MMLVELFEKLKTFFLLIFINTKARKNRKKFSVFVFYVTILSSPTIVNLKARIKTKITIATTMV